MSGTILEAKVRNKKCIVMNGKIKALHAYLLFALL